MSEIKATPVERLTDSTGLLALLAALTGIIAIALGLFGLETNFYLAEAVIAGLLLAMGLREVRARLHVKRQTRELRAKVREIQEKNRLLNLTENATKTGHWRLDLANDEILWSNGTASIHGLPPGCPPPLEDAIGFYHEDDRSIVTQSIASARETGNPYTFRARLIQADGELRHVEANARVELDAGGRPIALFGVLRDRTEEEQMQQELREARDEARALADAKNEFLAKMSHEIRTPMNGVLGFADLLKDSDLSPTQRRQVDLITESGRSLQSLLNDILDLTKIDSGHIEINPEPTDIAHLISRVAQMVEPAAREKSLTLDHAIDSALPRMVMADGLRLRQILTNLLSNAVRFTDRGKIRLSAVRRETRLEIQVADTGIGIAPEMQKTIFSAFAQADDVAARDRGGTGLGLAICRQLSALMNGTLKVQSIPGKGTAFTLSLPLIVANNSDDIQKAPESANAHSRLTGRRILLAEDFDINRELISQMSKQLGIELSMAEDGEQAVEMVQATISSHEPYELVLMDIRMPKMDGLEATRELRKRGFSPASLPIIAVTANAFDDDVDACIEAGMQAHLSKPLSLEKLRSALERWLPQKHDRAA